MIIEPSGSTFLPPGWGPRHMTIATNYGTDVEPRVYVINELKPFISIFNFDETTGILSNMVAMPLEPYQGSSGAEIMVHPNGKKLYCSVRDTSGDNGHILVYYIFSNGGIGIYQVCYFQWELTLTALLVLNSPLKSKKIC